MIDGSTSKLLSWCSGRLAFAAGCAVAGGLLLSCAPALAAGEPEAPITESCGRTVEPLQMGKSLVRSSTQQLTTPPYACGTLNPHSKSTVGYYFAYNRGGSCEGGEKTPPGPEAEVQDEEVSAQLSGLEPNSEYVYCLVATNANGETLGDPVSFVTQPVAPLVEDVSATNVSDDNAILEAQISPENSETKYEIVLADPCPAQMECIRDVPVASGTISENTARETVRVELASSKEHLTLEPDRTYDYWVIATNVEDWNSEVHKTFTTLNTSATGKEWFKEFAEENAKRVAGEAAVREAAARKQQEEAAVAAAKSRQEEEAAARKNEEAAVADTANVSLEGSTIAVRRNGVAALELACAGNATCSGKLTLTARNTVGKGKSKHFKTIGIGTADFSIPADTTATVELELNEAGRALLNAGRTQLTASLTVLKSSPAPSQTDAEKVELVQSKVPKLKRR